MNSSVVEAEITVQPGIQLIQSFIRFFISIFILQSVPESFDECVVKTSSLSIHSDYCAVTLNCFRKFRSSKLETAGVNLGQYQNDLIGKMLEYNNPAVVEKKILYKMEENDLSRFIFSESYLGYSINNLKNQNNGVKDPPNDFYQKIRNVRNQAGHAGHIFTREQAETAISDMSSYLQEWMEISFIKPL